MFFLLLYFHSLLYVIISYISFRAHEKFSSVAECRKRSTNFCLYENYHESAKPVCVPDLKVIYSAQNANDIFPQTLPQYVPSSVAHKFNFQWPRICHSSAIFWGQIEVLDKKNFNTTDAMLIIAWNKFCNFPIF